jgi:hypothetical protein
MRTGTACSSRPRNSLAAVMLRGAALVLIAAGLPIAGAQAYTAAGDRLFPATVLLPQIAPSDEAYVTTSTQPTSAGRATSLSSFYDKSITERWGIGVEEGYGWLDRRRGSTVSGWHNAEVTLRYLAVLDQPHEFVLSVGVDQEFGNTGAIRAGADRHGATTPTVYLGKGLGDLDIGYLRPLAIAATFGYQASNGNPRPDQVQSGVALQYSIPYLESKVESLQLPEFMRSMTPLVEYFYTTPSTPSHGQSTTATVAPGFSFAGDGWEFTIEALVPATHATGTGPGVTAQLHLSLDFLLPGSLGKPLFSGR